MDPVTDSNGHSAPVQISGRYTPYVCPSCVGVYISTLIACLSAHPPPRPCRRATLVVKPWETSFEKRNRGFVTFLSHPTREYLPYYLLNLVLHISFGGKQYSSPPLLSRNERISYFSRRVTLSVARPDVKKHRLSGDFSSTVDNLLPRHVLQCIDTRSMGSASEVLHLIAQVSFNHRHMIL